MLGRFRGGGLQLKGTRIGRTSTNQIARSFGEVNKSVKLRVWAEVQKHTDLKVRGAQVANQLRPGGRREFFRCFVLDNYRAVHDHVQPLPSDMAAFVTHGNE